MTSATQKQQPRQKGRGKQKAKSKPQPPKETPTHQLATDADPFVARGQRKVAKPKVERKASHDACVKDELDFALFEGDRWTRGFELRADVTQLCLELRGIRHRILEQEGELISKEIARRLKGHKACMEERQEKLRQLYSGIQIEA